jgi:hypothetical protein
MPHADGFVVVMFQGAGHIHLCAMSREWVLITSPSRHPLIRPSTGNTNGPLDGHLPGREEMRKATLVLTLCLVTGPAMALEPIPGSITYGGNTVAKLQKSPIGSSVNHRFSSGGSDYLERYVLMPDRSLKLVSRTRQGGR